MILIWVFWSTLHVLHVLHVLFCFFFLYFSSYCDWKISSPCLWLLKLMTSQVVKGRWMCTGSYGWFRCEKVKCRSKIKSVFNFSQYNLAPLRKNQRLQLLQILQQPIQKINTRNWWWHWKMGYKQYVWTDQQNTMPLH